jgi:DNA gyrase subunit A
VKTVQLTEAKGSLVGARVVREGYQVMLISTGGTVIRMPVDEIKRAGRSTQGVIVMRLRGDDERVSALAPVVESENGTAGPAVGDEEVATASAAEAEGGPTVEPEADDDGEV